ncbi:unnamed protein product [Amaranthus hypochondriacus]
MEKISINQLVVPVLATLLLLTTQTAPVVGKISSSATPSEEEMRTMMDYNKMAFENFAARMMIMSQRPHIVEVKDEAQNKEIGSVAAKKGLQCVSQGSYCNTFFGPSCCSSFFACIPWGLVGGVCVA